MPDQKTHDIRNEDCRVFLERTDVPYDYVLTSPPDFLEVDLRARDGMDVYEEFLRETYKLFQPRLGVVSLLMTDKKKDRRVYPKSALNIGIMESLGWYLRSEKIWLRQLTRNDYEMGFSFVLTFARNGVKPRENKHPDYMPDVYHVPRERGIRKYKHRHIGLNSFPTELGARFVHNFTQPGEIVCDPFMGIGGSALSALSCGRRVVGCELDAETHRLCLERISEALLPEESTLGLFGSP